jgi:hypothetical protein
MSARFALLIRESALDGWMAEVWLLSEKRPQTNLMIACLPGVTRRSAIAKGRAFFRRLQDAREQPLTIEESFHVR